MSISTVKIQQKIRAIIATSFAALVLSMGGTILVLQPLAYAQDAPAQNNTCPEGYIKNLPNFTDDDPSNDKPCVPEKLKDTGDPAASGKKNFEYFVNQYINPLMFVLTALIGLGSAISLVYAGIQYTTSAGDPGKAQEARERFTKTVVGLIAYLFLFGFLQWVVPGGLF